MNILKVSETNCYPDNHGCIHTCTILKDDKLENVLLNSAVIYSTLKEQAPMHIKKYYEESKGRVCKQCGDKFITTNTYCNDGMFKYCMD